MVKSEKFHFFHAIYTPDNYEYNPRMNIRKVTVISAVLLAVGVLGAVWLDVDGKIRMRFKEFSQHPRPNYDAASEGAANGAPSATLSGEVNEHGNLIFPNNSLDISDWKTYRNDQFGFEVRYLSGWDVTIRTKEDIQKIDPSMSLSSSFMGSVGFDTHEPYSGISILIYNQDIESLVEERGWAHFKDPGPGSSVKTRVNNVEAYYFLRKGTNEIYPGVYFLGDSTHGFEVTHATSDDNEKAFQQMLLSFKLIK